MIFNNEVMDLINQSRTLTISNNRKIDYLMVDCGREDTTVIGLQESCVNDIIYMDNIKSTKLKDIAKTIKDICYEFNIDNVLIDNCGMGTGLIENLELDKTIVKPFNNCQGKDYLFDFHNDISKGRIRFLQSSLNAKSSYKKPFLGYSNIMKLHNSTDEFIEDIKNCELDGMSGKLKIIGKTKYLGCLLMYYNYKRNLFKEIVNDSKEKAKRDTNIKMAKYEILHGLLYKHMYNSIEHGNLTTIFYMEDWSKLLKFRAMVQEEEFKNRFKTDMKNLLISKDNLQIQLFNGSIIRFLKASLSAKGYKYNFAIVDTNINRKEFDEIIDASLVPYRDDRSNPIDLNNNYYMEYADFNC